MKSKFQNPLICLLALLCFNSCQQKELFKGKFQSGVFVANEGAFGSGNGDVTYYNGSAGSLQQTIYKQVNGSFAGDVLESVTISGDLGYLVLNGSNKIEVIDNNTFKHANTLTDERLVNPRYVEVINGKAYVSVWGAYDPSYSLIDSYILIFDTKTSLAIDTINTDEGTENLLYNGQYLFASNYNYGGSNTVNVINPTTNKSIKKIMLYAGPGGMALDANNKLWVIAQGTFAGNDGKLFRINPSTFLIEQTIELGVNPSNPDLAISPDKKNLYYYEGASIYKIGIEATTAPSASWVTNADIVSPYALGVDSKTGDVYLGDAIHFSSEGKVYVYSSDASLETTFGAGINPGQFIFK